jgi:2-polyprenyl-6-hydroxyphenyl methylase/3-demethylubiquinone-9 3-methyltransferase
MRRKFDKNAEFIHFQELSNEWWDPNGKFKVLHTLTPIRIKYIKDNICLVHDNITKNNKILKGLDILDLGCGGGLVCEPLARLGAKVTGIDFVEKNIKTAKRHAKISKLNITYVNQDLLSIKLNKQFDVILMLEIIEHLNNWQIVVNKIIKLLKPNGKIIFSTINRTFYSRLFAIFLAEEVLRWIPKNTHYYEKLVKPKELIFFLKKNNMKILNTTGLVFNPILKEWFLNKTMTKINYFCTAQKI